MNNEILKNKQIYKILLVIIKYLPIILFGIQTFLLGMNYMGIVLPVMTCIGGSSLIFMATLLIISKVFRFCYLYRIPIWGNIIIGMITILRISGYIPISLISLYRLYAIIVSIVILLFIIIKYKNRNKPKVNYLRNFCERYCC